MTDRSARATAPSPSGCSAFSSASGSTPGMWTTLYLAVLLALSALTILNRARSIVAEAKATTP